MRSKVLAWYGIWLDAYCVVIGPPLTELRGKRRIDAWFTLRNPQVSVVSSS